MCISQRNRIWNPSSYHNTCDLYLQCDFFKHWFNTWNAVPGHDLNAHLKQGDQLLQDIHKNKSGKKDAMSCGDEATEGGSRLYMGWLQSFLYCNHMNAMSHEGALI